LRLGLGQHLLQLCAIGTRGLLPVLLFVLPGLRAAHNDRAHRPVITMASCHTRVKSASNLDLAGPPPALSVDELQADSLAVLLAPATSPLLGIPPSGSPDLLRSG